MSELNKLEEQLCEDEVVVHTPKEFFDAIDEMCSTCPYVESECDDCPVLAVRTVFSDASFLLKLKFGDVLVFNTDEGVHPYTIVYNCEFGYSIVSMLTGMSVDSSIYTTHDLIVALVTLGDILTIIDGADLCKAMEGLSGLSFNKMNIEPQLIFD